MELKEDHLLMRLENSTCLPCITDRHSHTHAPHLLCTYSKRPVHVLLGAYHYLQLQRGRRTPAGLPAQMGRRALEQTLPDESLAEQQLDVLLSPVPRGQGLQEHHDLLEVHLEQPVRPLDQEGCTHVEMELREALLLCLW